MSNSRGESLSDTSLQALDWDAFRVILAIYRQGSLSGGARILGVNQATVARHLSRAEATLDAKLFNRLSNGLFPTEAGRVAVSFAVRIEDEVAAANLKLLGANEKEAGNIRFSVPLNAMPFGLASDIEAFLQIHPDVTFDILASDATANFQERKVDVVLRADNNPSSGLWGYRLADIHYSFYASSQFMDKWRVEMKRNPKTVPLPVIVLSNSDPASDRDQIFSKFPNAKVVAKCNGLDTVLPLINNHVGAARIARFMAPSHPNLEMVMECAQEHAKTLWILTHPDYRQTHRVRLFMEFIRDRYSARANQFI